MVKRDKQNANKKDAKFLEKRKVRKYLSYVYPIGPLTANTFSINGMKH